MGAVDPFGWYGLNCYLNSQCHKYVYSYLDVVLIVFLHRMYSLKKSGVYSSLRCHSSFK